MRTTKRPSGTGMAGHMGQVRIDRGRRAVAFAVVVLAGSLTLAGTAQYPAAAAVTAVKGGADGYRLQVSLFGGPVNTRGVGQVTCSSESPPIPPGCVPADQAAEASSPSVMLPSDGGRLNDSKPEGAAARSGPATFFSSGQLDVATQGAPGAGGSVTSSTSVLDINREGSETFTAVAASSTCSASETGVSAATTITGGTLMTDSGDDGTGVAHDPVVVNIPTNPEPNTTYEGHIHVNGTTDSFRYVFNEQVVNLDGSITVYAAHQYLLGPTAVGDLYIGKAECGVTGDGTVSPTTTTSGVPTTVPNVPTTVPVSTTLAPTPSTTVPDDYLTQICNPAPIVQPNDFTFVDGRSTPYPSPIVVSGLTGTVTDVDVSLLDFTTSGGEGNTWPNDMDILAAAPDNSNVILMSDAGGDNNVSKGSVVAVDLTFDDEAAEQLPANELITSGTWRPVDDDGDPPDDAGNPDTWPPPAPPLMDTTLLSTFDGIDPNGVWSLFANDDQVLGTTQILGGWCLNITTTTSSTGPTTTTTVPTTTTTTTAPTTTTSTTLPPAAERAPVADFDGDSDSDRSVFRNGAWYAEGQPTAFLGVSGDIPVPGDYDGDGTTERAVYRKGAWYVEGQPTAYLGNASDIPVPGDYDGDGDSDRAVYRKGAWYVEGQPTAYLGASGDIPVPGDYDGDGDSDRAVWRPSVGGWYVQGSPSTFLGVNGDIPVPGDYDGDGDSDRAVYRNGAWHVEGSPPIYLGNGSDIPLPLPQAVYRAFFSTS